MRTFAEKPKASQQATSSKTTVPARSPLGQGHDVHSILHLQRTIGNQAVNRLLQTYAVQRDNEQENTTSPHFGYDFSRIPVTHPKAGAIQTKLEINKPGDEYEQEADRVADQVMRNPASLTPLVTRPLSRPSLIQRNGMAYAYVRRLQVRHMYDDFVRNAERYGLPVRFLRRVGRDYDISFGSSSAVNYWLNTMTLEEEDLRSASQMAPALPIGEASAIRTIYEEATHAYLDLVSDEPRFSRFIAAGERHYRGAPTTRATTTTDPGRVFQEAAGTYVGHRAAVWWTTFESLSIYASMASSDAAAARRLREMNSFARLRDDYNRQMAEVVFGYSEEGGFLGIGSEQVVTTRAMTGEMKTFLDHELLEDKISDRFEAVVGFQQLLSQAGVTLSGAGGAGPTPPLTTPPVQRQLAGTARFSPAEALEGVEDVLRSSGRPLDAETRREMGRHFDYDFSRVRVHTDARAAESAMALNSSAYTIRQHIVFGQGQYAPDTSTGKKLLAHELTHVLQQRQSDS